MTNKPNASRHAPEEIDAYLAALPDDVGSSLERVRSSVRETAPHCTERVSYGIPIFRLQKDLVGISAQKHRCAFRNAEFIPQPNICAFDANVTE